MEDKPRYSRLSDILQLIILMQSKLNGVTINDIQQEFNVSRRTAERMRDCVLLILPQVNEIESNSRQKHWGFINYSLKEIISFTPEEIATLVKVKDKFDLVSNRELQTILTKIKALSDKSKMNYLQEIEFLLHSEGYAIKQGTNYKFDVEIISTIRKAIKENLKLKANYKEKERLLSPLGLIFGEKIYLIAREEDKGVGEFSYVLHKFKNMKLTKEKFDFNGFNLKEFSQKSFGVYQGKVYNIKLQFSPEVCEDVLNYNFHPTQKFKPQEDGSLIVNFKACSEKAIMWNLFKWEDKVKILKPKKLKYLYKEYLKKVLTGIN